MTVAGAVDALDGHHRLKHLGDGRLAVRLFVGNELPVELEDGPLRGVELLGYVLHVLVLFCYLPLVRRGWAGLGVLSYLHLWVPFLVIYFNNYKPTMH